MISSFLYESVLDNSPSGHYFLSPSDDPVILEVNATFLKTVSRTRDDLVGMKLFTVFAGDPNDTEDTGVDELRRSLQRVIKTGKPDQLPIQRYPIKITLPDGTEQYQERFWSATNTPLFDEQGQLLYISHHTSEITEQVYAENALRKSELRYLSLIESIDEGFCVIKMLFDSEDKPIDYIFHEINPIFEAQTGLRNARGRSMLELVPEHESHWFEIYGKVAKTGEPIRFESEAKALNRWFDVYAYRVDEPDEQMVAILFRDVTQKKQQEINLLQSESRLRALITATAEVLYRMSPDWSEILQLEGRGFLKDVHQSKKLWLDEYVPHEDQLSLHKTLESAIRNKTLFEVELRVHLANGSIGWVESRAIPMLDSNGEIIEWLGALSDITERKQREEELKETGRRKDDFLAMLAHELRNPLAPISAAANLLNLMKSDDKKITQCSEIISRQVSHMTGLVNDLLDVSRVTRGLITLNQEEIDLNEIIANSIEQVRPLIKNREHQLTVHTPQQPAMVLGDHKRLVQVFTNLLGNAAKYTPNGGEIDLNMELDGDYAKITITDNGVGMEPEMVIQAFELFTQGSRSSDRSQGGLGIGLALVKSLVESHAGKISAMSQGLGQGSQFTLWLPQLTYTINQKSRESGTLTVDEPAQTTKIMVVDDNIDAADTLSILLEACGYQVIVEYSSIKALERSKIEKPTIYLLDIGLPDMDGNELVQRLRAQPETANATFIAITGYGQDQELNNGVNTGFDHYFVKPVEAKKLLTLLNSIVIE